MVGIPTCRLRAHCCAQHLPHHLPSPHPTHPTLSPAAARTPPTMRAHPTTPACLPASAALYPTPHLLYHLVRRHLHGAALRALDAGLKGIPLPFPRRLTLPPCPDAWTLYTPRTTAGATRNLCRTAHGVRGVLPYRVAYALERDVLTFIAVLPFHRHATAARCLHPILLPLLTLFPPAHPPPPAATQHYFRVPRSIAPRHALLPLLSCAVARNRATQRAARARTVGINSIRTPAPSFLPSRMAPA